MWLFKRKNNEEYQLQLQENLITSSAYFLELYSQRQDDLIRASGTLRQLAVQVCAKKEEKKILGTLFGAGVGAVLGTNLGGVVGGTGAFFGTTGVITYTLLYSFDIDVSDVAISVESGIIGGIVGGTFSGGLGGAIGAGAEAACHQTESENYVLALAIIGGTTGYAIGDIFGGPFGAVGGMFGGAFGGLCGFRMAVDAIRILKSIVKETRKSQHSETQQAEIQGVEVLQKTGQDIQETIKPLLEELNRIKSISTKMDSRACFGQSTKTLTALATMEKVLRKIQTTKDEAKMMSWVEEAAQKSIQITEELQKMKAEVDKLLAEGMVTLNI